MQIYCLNCGAVLSVNADNDGKGKTRCIKCNSDSVVRKMTRRKTIVEIYAPHLKNEICKTK